jgi:P pilus assembly chaperone PapD
MGDTRRLAGCLLVLGGLAASGAHANMVLSEVILDLPHDERRRDIEVWNSGEDMLYIQVEVSRVLDPEAEKPQREKLEDPRSAGLLATPNLMALSPDERKLLRVVVRQPASDIDLIYRVSLIPKENQGESEAKLAFKVLIGYEVLVIVRPPNARPQLQVERNGRQLRMSNTGNSSILVRKMDQCRGNEEGCPELPGNRLYAGESWDYELPEDAPVRVFQSFGSENSVQSF